MRIFSWLQEVGCCTAKYSMLLPIERERERAFISLCDEEREFLSLQRMIQKNSITCQFCFSAVKAECYFVCSYLRFSLVGFQVTLMSAVHNSK